MAQLKNKSDLELINLLKLSDHSAYAEIFKRYHVLLLSHAFKKLQDKELAKDIVQDLFVNLWYKREQILSTHSLAPFLFVTLKNRMIDHFLHSNVESKYITSLANNFDNVYTSSTDHLVREKQLAKYIELQIQKLPIKMRKAFELSKIDQLSNREVAGKLNTTETNVSQHVNNAIRILKVKLRPLFTVLMVLTFLFVAV